MVSAEAARQPVVANANFAVINNIKNHAKSAGVFR